ncbi:hypothetical protein [Gilliamella sp. wkB112]|uniref:hypothetical protein n=1 Tax=Gilliamella sp. wkB112 TaxID=3120257 RepID=UPI0009BE2DF8|nr:hypothetical protein [Gilliamella apicola]
MNNICETISNEMIEFAIELQKIASKKFSASTATKGAEPFEKKLFNEYKLSYPEKLSKKSLKEWITKRLENEFKCIGEKPKWKDESEWCYLEGEPMVFITQYSIPVSDKTRKTGLALGDTFYIFGGKIINRDDTWEQKYKIIIQDIDGYLIENEIIY